MYLLFAFQNQLKILIIKVFTLNVKMSLRERFLNACWDSDLVNVKDCLKKGVDVNTVGVSQSALGRGWDTWSGLKVAAFKDYPELLDLLLSQPGINVNLPTRHVRSFGSEWTPLMFACQMGNHEIVRKLLQMPGIDILNKDDDGWTALHVAANWGNSKCLEELAKVPGLEWSCKDIDGQTPLYLALLNGHPDCVRIIASQPRVDVAVKTNHGQTLVEAALEDYDDEDLSNGMPWHESIKILADVHEVDWNVKMSTGDTPIMHCLNHGNTNMLEILAKSPWANLNIQDDDGDTPVIWCLKNEMMEGLRILLDCPRVELGSAITWALEKKQMNIVERLGQALGRRQVDAKNRFNMSWRGGASGSAGMREEMSKIKIRLQLESYRKKIYQSAQKMVESNNNYEEK